MAETTIDILKDALASYREALNAIPDDEWEGLVSELGFNPEDDAWPHWNDRDEGIREELDDLNFIIPIDLEKPILEQIQEDA